MLRRALAPAAFLLLGAAPSTHRKSPPWLSVESPVDPYDAGTCDAVFLVHARVRGGTTSVAVAAREIDSVLAESSRR